MRAVVGVVRGQDDRQAVAQALHQLLHRLRRAEPAVEHDARQRGEAVGRACRDEGEQHVGAIARHDAQLAVAQALEHVLGVHAAHEHVLGLAAEQ